MEYGNRVYLPTPSSTRVEPPVLQCLPGKVAVAMDSVRTSYGNLALPDEVQGRLRPDCGTVAAVGSAVMSQKGFYGYDNHLRRGDRVCVRASQGMWEDAMFHPVQVRFYGLAHGHGVAQRVDWWDDVILWWDNEEWRPTGRNLLVKRHKDVNPLFVNEKWLRQGMVMDQGPYMEDDCFGKVVAWSEGVWDDVMILDNGDGNEEMVVVPDYLVHVVQD